MICIWDTEYIGHNYLRTNIENGVKYYIKNIGLKSAFSCKNQSYFKLLNPFKENLIINIVSP